MNAPYMEKFILADTFDFLVADFRRIQLQSLVDKSTKTHVTIEEPKHLAEQGKKNRRFLTYDFI
jgi:uncharacterized protein with ATP-grasp and redox domains